MYLLTQMSINLMYWFLSCKRMTNLHCIINHVYKVVVYLKHIYFQKQVCFFGKLLNTIFFLNETISLM